MAFQLRRGTDAERTAGGGIVFAEGELIYITDTEEVYVGDGVTGGGILVTGNSNASPSILTRNLALGGFEINGTGDIDITGDITISGNISAANLSGGGTGVIAGQEYSIDIQGDVRGADSSIIVDSASGIVYADFVGDGSLITNISIDQLDDVVITNPQNEQVLKYVSGQWVNSIGGGVPEGSNARINIVATDSTTLVDSETGTFQGIYGFGSNVNMTENSGDIRMTKTDSGVSLNVLVRSLENASNLRLHRTSSSDISGTDVRYGQIQFGRDDLNGVLTTARISANRDFLWFHHAADGNTLESKTMTIKEGDVGIGTLSPDEKLDVRGNIAIQNGSIRITDNRGIADITDATEGDIKYDVTEQAIVWYDNSDWKKAVGTNLTNNLTTLEAGLILGLSTQAELDSFNEDSTNTTGAIAYNEDTDRFEMFQRGSWVGLPNSGEHDGQLLQWNHTDKEWEYTDFQTPQVGQILQWNGANWAPANNSGGGGGGGGGAFTNIGIYADDSTVRLINEQESFGILGGTNISTTSDAEGNITITNDFVQNFTWGVITGTPTTVSGYGITDAIVDSDLGNFTFTTSTLDTSDSSGITVTPAMTIQSDLTVENDLRVTNTVYAERFESTTTGTPEIEAATNLNLRAGNAVVITSSPVRMASFTTAERDALASQNGDMIYNETTNKFQGYANGSWVDLH
jgi:hypothetical protein